VKKKQISYHSSDVVEGEGFRFGVFICTSLNLLVRFYQSFIVGFQLKMPKRKCNFTDDLKVEFPFLKEENGGRGRGRRKVFCTCCR
jgi:hypothetical protein